MPTTFNHTQIDAVFTAAEILTNLADHAAITADETEQPAHADMGLTFLADTVREVAEVMTRHRASQQNAIDQMRSAIPVDAGLTTPESQEVVRQGQASITIT